MANPLAGCLRAALHLTFLVPFTLGVATASTGPSETGVSSEGAPRPRLELPRSEYQAGRMMPGPTLEVAFAVRNTGDAPLQIAEARPDCGCMVADYDREIAPGAMGAGKTDL